MKKFVEKFFEKFPGIATFIAFCFLMIVVKTIFSTSPNADGGAPGVGPESAMEIIESIKNSI